MILPANDGDQRRAVVLGVDVGSTNVRCYAYDQCSKVIGKSKQKLETSNPSDGRYEIVPDELWKSFQKVINNCLISSNLQATEVSCMGISTQRGTFLTWNRDTGQPYHNFISWKDTRADAICDRWNSSIFIKLLRFICFIIYMFTRMTKFQVYSNLKFSSAMVRKSYVSGIRVLTRFYWILENVAQLRQRASNEPVLFGTIDTWLVWKLTNGKVHATDSSNACVTGFFDPFKMEWVGWLLDYLHIPKHILPVIKNTCDDFGETNSDIFGASIPICCLVGDQQASLFGACCFEECSVNCTMGTGSFLCVNTGNKPSTTEHGIVPLIGWTISSNTTYVAECGIYETGPFVTWLQNLGFLKDPSESSVLVRASSDTNGVFFLPARSSLKSSKSAKQISSQLVGLSINTTKEQIVKSVLESLAFQACLLFEAVHHLYCRRREINSIRICGGVAKNDFVVQVISDIIARPVHRLKHDETSSLGAAFLAGLHHGVWKTLKEISELCEKQTGYDTFSPNHVSENAFFISFKKWKNILKHLPTDNSV